MHYVENGVFIGLRASGVLQIPVLRTKYQRRLLAVL
jgi:hypothetical protein